MNKIKISKCAATHQIIIVLKLIIINCYDQCKYRFNTKVEGEVECQGEVSSKINRTLTITGICNTPVCDNKAAHFLSYENNNYFRFEYSSYHLHDSELPSLFLSPIITLYLTISATHSIASSSSLPLISSRHESRIMRISATQCNSIMRGEHMCPHLHSPF